MQLVRPGAGGALGDAVLSCPTLARGHLLQGSSHTRWECLPFWKRGDGAHFSYKPDRPALAPWGRQSATQ